MLPGLRAPQANPYAANGPMNQAPEVTLGHELLTFYLHLLHSIQSDDKFKILVNFFGISVPFCANKYKHNMEFAVSKQSMGRANDNFFEKQIKKAFKRWQTRWLVVGYNNLFYYQYPEDPPHAIRDSIPFDNDMTFDILKIGRSHVTSMITISRRKLKLSIEGTMNGLICMSYIIRAFRLSPYTAPHRFTSFAPPREGNDCVFFADGVGYYKELYEALNIARSEIMITDWWLSPEFPLIRPIKGSLEDEPSRVDFTLKRAAERGVKVYVLIYKEFTLGLNTDSEHAKQRLESMHKNIKVIRHPNVVISLWSHHEKMCIVDKGKVFMGGLDLCWNRMDGNNHPLFNNADETMFPAVDYGNPLCKDIVKGREYKTSMIKQTEARMPWHDVACMLVGKICNDFVMHFSSYWNHAKETNHEREVIAPKKTKHVYDTKNVVYIAEGLEQNDPLQQSAFGEPLDYEDMQIDPYMAQGNTFAGLGGACRNPRLIRSQSADDRDIRAALDGQKALTDQYPRYQSPTAGDLALYYNRNMPQRQPNNLNPLMTGIYGQTMRPGFNQRPQLGGHIPLPYRNVQQPGFARQPGGAQIWNQPGYQMPHTLQLNRGNIQRGPRGPGQDTNVFEVLSGNRTAEESAELLFGLNSLDAESERPKWRTWLSENHQKLNNVSTMKHGDAENFRKFMEGMNVVSNNPMAVEKMNRCLFDIDEKSSL